MLNQSNILIAKPQHHFHLQSKQLYRRQRKNSMYILKLVHFKFQAYRISGIQHNFQRNIPRIHITFCGICVQDCENLHGWEMASYSDEVSMTRCGFELALTVTDWLGSFAITFFSSVLFVRHSKVDITLDFCDFYHGSLFIFVWSKHKACYSLSNRHAYSLNNASLQFYICYLYLIIYSWISSIGLILGSWDSHTDTIICHRDTIYSYVIVPWFQDRLSIDQRIPKTIPNITNIPISLKTRISLLLWHHNRHLPLHNSNIKLQTNNPLNIW